MRPGPVPVPSAVRAVRNPRFKAPVDEPKPRAAVPRCPEHVKWDPKAQRAWRHYARLLKRMNVLTEADASALADLAIMQASYLRAWKIVCEMNKASKLGVGGMVGKAKTDYWFEVMLFSQVTRLADSKRKLYGEFGLTPSSRMRVKTTDPGEANSSQWAKFNRTSAAR